MTTRKHRGTDELVEILLLAAAGIGLLALIIWVAVATLSLRSAPCHTPPVRIGQWPALMTVVVAVLFFGLGRLAGYWREPDESPAVLRGGAQRLRVRAALLQVTLTAFLFLVILWLAYETYALANWHLYWPITYYVRCANEVATLPTAAGAWLICFLLGQWLWYPGKRA